MGKDRYSRRTEIDKKRSVTRHTRWIKKYAENAIKKGIEFFRLDIYFQKNSKLHQELLALEFGRKTAVRDYYIKKIKMVAVLVIMGVLLTLLCFLGERKMDYGIEANRLERPGYGEGSRTEILEVQILEEVQQEEKVQKKEKPQRQKQIMEVTVQERAYTDQEKQILLEDAVKELEKVIRGENLSLDEVRKDLVLPTTLAEGRVMVNWITVPYGIVNEDGTLQKAEDEKGVLVELQGTMNCGGKESIYIAYAKVFPPERSAEERLLLEIEGEVESADAKARHEAQMYLPEQVGDYQLYWEREKENRTLSVFTLLFLVIVCVYIQADQEVHKKAEKRKHQLIVDYPDLMWKMTMLLGAGLSIRGTFERIAEEYKKKKVEVRWLYEEVCCTCFEMQKGISEAKAYERFGKRCQLPEYIRLGTMLSQNVRKGAKGLTDLLEREAEASMNERKNHARKIGEQAGTKMLLPMVLMLGIVLVILMVPAFISF